MKNDRSARGRDRGRRPRPGTGADRAPAHEHRRSSPHRHPSTGRLQIDGPLIIGRNSLREVLRRAPERLLRVYLTDSVLASGDECGALVIEHGIPHDVRHAAELTGAAGSDSHQGVVGVLKNRHHPELKTFLEEAIQRPRALIILADSIYDPHNLGAILRAGECFGLHGVLLSKNRGTGITPAVTKSSVGASEFVPVCIVSNLAQSLQRAIELGFVGIAADVGPDAVALSHANFPSHAVLVLGSEGEGVQPLLRKLCQMVVTIPMAGSIDSLNVSQAAAVMAYAWAAQGAR